MASLSLYGDDVFDISIDWFITRKLHMKSKLQLKKKIMCKLDWKNIDKN